MKQARKICKDWESLPMIMDVDTTALALNVSASTVYKLCNGHVLSAVRIGNSWRIYRDELRKYIDGMLRG